MSRTTVRRTIDAPIDRVFAAVADVRNFQKAVPHLVEVEFLSDTKTGVGTRFRETRDMNGRTATTELECTEYVENDHVRMVSDAGGTIWDSVFKVSPNGNQTDLELVMDARPHKFLARLVTPLIKGTVQKAIEKDLDAVKSFCETNP